MSQPTRAAGRALDALRPVSLQPDYIIYPEGSVLIAAGNTRVLCNVSIEDGVPPWLESRPGDGGWITAEYAMLPRSTHTRTSRETGAPRARSQEIKRLIGRSLRAGFDLDQLGPITCIVDCDVLQADGGTRTASVTGGYVALAMALFRRVKTGETPVEVFKAPVAAVSAGVVDGKILLDLDYAEDSHAEVDANLVMNAQGAYLELQMTAERTPLARTQLEALLDVAERGIRQLMDRQLEMLIDHGFPTQELPT